MKFQIRQTVKDDIAAITAFDHIAQTDSCRVDYICLAINNCECYLVLSDKQIIGYGVMSNKFFKQGMIELIYVHPDFRQQGAGKQMLEFFESICKAEKLFSSTNQSNTKVQRWLESAGFVRSGIIDNLDEGDPELIYFKKLK